MSKKKNKKTSKNANHKKNTKATKPQVQTKVQEQPEAEIKAEVQVADQTVKPAESKAEYGFFKKCIASIKLFFSKFCGIGGFVKKHKTVFTYIFALIYTLVIVGATLTVEHFVLPCVMPESVEVENVAKPVEIKRFTMDKGQVYRMSPTCVLQYEGYEFTSTIKPKNAEKAGEYFGQSYVNENEDNIYLDVVIKYINKSNEPVRGDKIINMVTYAGDESYQDIFTAIENKDGTGIDFSSSVEIAPGDYALVHCVFDVPRQTKDMPGIYAEIVADNKVYTIEVTEEISETKKKTKSTF